MNTISLKLPDRLLELLKEESRARRTTKSALVREYLEKTLAARAPDGEPTCYDLAHDLAGSVKGLPRDLATNPKYLSANRRPTGRCASLDATLSGSPHVARRCLPPPAR